MKNQVLLFYGRAIRIVLFYDNREFPVSLSYRPPNEIISFINIFFSRILSIPCNDKDPFAAMFPLYRLLTCFPSFEYKSIWSSPGIHDLHMMIDFSIFLYNIRKNSCKIEILAFYETYVGIMGVPI